MLKFLSNKYIHWIYKTAKKAKQPKYHNLWLTKKIRKRSYYANMQIISKVHDAVMFAGFAQSGNTFKPK